jgi:hypothetical protein
LARFETERKRTVTIAIDADQAVLAQVYLRAMASAIEGVAHAARPEDQQEFWTAYAENEAKLHTIIPPPSVVALEQRANPG